MITFQTKTFNTLLLIELISIVILFFLLNFSSSTQNASLFIYFCLLIFFSSSLFSCARNRFVPKIFSHRSSLSKCVHYVLLQNDGDSWKFIIIFFLSFQPYIRSRWRFFFIIEIFILSFSLSFISYTIHQTHCLPLII